MITLSELWIDILLAPERHRLTVTEVCRRYGISRKTYYAYQARYRAEAVEGLEPRSCRPKTSPLRTPPEVEAMVVDIRVNRPRRGARKIRAELTRRGLHDVPAVSTVHTILRREGLVNDQRRRRRLAWQRFERSVPNDLWQLDATQVLLAEKSKAWIVDALDDHARFAMAARAGKQATTVVVWECMDEAIRLHGAPRQVISDNRLSFTGCHHKREVLFENNFLDVRDLRFLSLRSSDQVNHPLVADGICWPFADLLRTCTRAALWVELPDPTHKAGPSR